ncbi:killer cell lectin-like receptor subfamily I member 1 isoform X4 [Grammomys surdaster]|nr:killer cell lectin-like receptor subfamily I member 1 isoform X4 [Grammomys surdaster]
MNCSGNTPEQEQQATKTEVNQKEMPHSKYHEYIANKQDVTYTEMKTYKSPQKHRTPTAKQSPVVLSDEQVKYAELTFHRTPQFQPRKLPVRRKRQGPKWRVVTSMLGALCVVLMTTVGILLPKLLSSQEEQSRQTSFPPLLCPKEDDSSYDLCSSDWIAFGNHFYQAFHGTKTWAESQSACEELKSHLVIIDSEEELGGFFSKRMEPTGPGYGEMTVKHSTPSAMWEDPCLQMGQTSAAKVKGIPVRRTKEPITPDANLSIRSQAPT